MAAPFASKLKWQTPPASDSDSCEITFSTPSVVAVSTAPAIGASAPASATFTVKSAPNAISPAKTKVQKTASPKNRDRGKDAGRAMQAKLPPQSNPRK
jgi:hypothetical protein